jgi:uncharacterized membrane protein YccC
LALVIVYYIALNLDWMNPCWAAWAVAMISLPTAGQSLQKGMLRLWGTIPACIAGLIILGLAPQNRWAFMLLASGWIFFTTYMMLVDKKRAYFWNVAGFVCLIILLGGAGGTDNIFQFAAFRTAETAMGVIVYTLVTVFLWPRTNAGAIKKASGDLVTTQASLFQLGMVNLVGENQPDHHPAKIQQLQAREVQQLGQLAQALQAEGSESYQVQELLPAWERFHALSTALMKSLDRWQFGLSDLSRIDPNQALPDLAAFAAGLNRRFEEIGRALAGSRPERGIKMSSLTINRAAIENMSHLDRAALAVTKAEFENLERQTAKLLVCAYDLAGLANGTQTMELMSQEESPGKRFNLPALDLDHIWGAAFAATTVALGFLLWIYVDPPGHSAWLQFPGVIAMAVAGMPQLRASILAKSIGLALVIVLGVYIFVMPKLSNFAELGTLLFGCMFIACFFFTGLARLAAIVGVVNQIAIQNQQSYSFAAMANSLIFMVLAIYFVYLVSYMLRSPRPEKAVLHQVLRYFRAAARLVALFPEDPEHATKPLARLKKAFYRYEINTLPVKITGWAKGIGPGLFPDNTPDKVQELATSLQMLAYRLDELLDSGHTSQRQTALKQMGVDFKYWQKSLERTFVLLEHEPEARMAEDQQSNLPQRFSALETRIEEAAQQARGLVPETQGESFYGLLGSYRGVSSAVSAYMQTAGRIDWSAWREERFS